MEERLGSVESPSACLCGRVRFGDWQPGHVSDIPGWRAVKPGRPKSARVLLVWVRAKRPVLPNVVLLAGRLFLEPDEHWRLTADSWVFQMGWTSEIPLNGLFFRNALIINVAKYTLADTIRNPVRLLSQDLAIQVQETSFDNRSGSVDVDFIESVVARHIIRNAVMRFQAGGFFVAPL